MGSTPSRDLYYAAVTGDLSAMRRALENGADVNCRVGKHDETPLMAAARKGFVRAVTLLLHSGALDLKDSRGATAMHVAAKHGHVAVVAVLLDRGADHFAIDKRQFRAIDWAALKGHAPLLRMMEVRTCPFAWDVKLHQGGLFTSSWQQAWLCVHRARPFDNPAMPRNAVIACLYEGRGQTFPLFRLGQPVMRGFRPPGDPTMQLVTFDLASTSAAKRGGSPTSRTVSLRAPVEVALWLWNVLADEFASGRGPAFDDHGAVAAPADLRAAEALVSTDTLAGEVGMGALLRALPRAITAAQAAAMERANRQPGGEEKNHGYHYWQAPGPLPVPPRMRAAAGLPQASTVLGSPAGSAAAALARGGVAPTAPTADTLLAPRNGRPAVMPPPGMIGARPGQAPPPYGAQAAPYGAMAQQHLATQERSRAQVRADQQATLAVLGATHAQQQQMFLHSQQQQQQQQQQPYQQQQRPQQAAQQRGGYGAAPAPAPSPTSGSYVYEDKDRLEDLDFDTEAPGDYLCPITMELMVDPVVAGDGHTYSRAGITRWLRDHRTSPKTNEVLSDGRVVPNHLLRGQVLDWIDAHRSDKKEAAKAAAAAAAAKAAAIAAPPAAAAPSRVAAAPSPVAVDSTPRVDAEEAHAAGPSIGLPSLAALPAVPPESSSAAVADTPREEDAATPEPPARRSSVVADASPAVADDSGSSATATEGAFTAQFPDAPQHAPVVAAEAAAADPAPEPVEG